MPKTQIYGDQIASGTITGNEVLDESLTGFDIENGTITRDDIKPDVISGIIEDVLEQVGGNIDGGHADSIYGGIPTIDGGHA